ncbi:MULTISPECIES: AMP-binding protein [Methylomonas]|uniref:AMP-dependent synthetase/ligase domain-containing protein n=1 Tax=Methylomonas koyamae TaxID=702114 RepID=A0A177NQ12_9GAMM|nr:AMP-binding protein [Methylomonas koyamae]OAI20156.1 hypothetical protein A1355_03095 [Methylomonas koyamae]
MARAFDSADDGRPVAWHRGLCYTRGDFRLAVAAWAERFAADSHPRYGLYCQDAYPFAVLLFALWQAGKQVWLAANNRPDTGALLESEDCRLLGDWPAQGLSGPDFKAISTEASGATDAQAPEPACFSRPWTAWRAWASGTDRQPPDLALFTSGSTGVAKPIFKSQRQLWREVAGLEAQWGGLLGACRVAGTVGHQHIYGLLFRVLWPLAAGRGFISETALDAAGLPERVCWIASPAHLKRLDAESCWAKIAGFPAVFSSGGPLAAAAAECLARQTGLAALEIYGSSETGGIAWRRFPDNGWRLFAGLTLSPDGELSSPYLPDAEPYPLDDALAWRADGCFELMGRRDRIVKIEEKRLSLTELEQCLLAGGWLAEAVALPISGRRDAVAVAGVLSATGHRLMLGDGRKALIAELREGLLRHFEAVLLPRRWLFFSTLPETSAGKPDVPSLRRWLVSDDRLPLPRQVRWSGDSAELTLKIPADLRYFADHFPRFAILPGVVQLAWVEYYGRLLFGFVVPFRSLEAIKFVQPIRPDSELQLNLTWRAAAGRLGFEFRDADRAYSSGRLIQAEA